MTYSVLKVPLNPNQPTNLWTILSLCFCCSWCSHHKQGWTAFW